MPPLKEYLNNKESLIYTLQFALDIPANQYRTTQKIYFFQNFVPDKFPSLKKITLNYCDAGHSKGAPNDVGATIQNISFTTIFSFNCYKSNFFCSKTV